MRKATCTRVRNEQKTNTFFVRLLACSKPYEKTFIPGQRTGFGGLLRLFVGNRVWLVCVPMKIQSAHFRCIERACTAAAEDGELIAGFVDGTIAVDSLRNGKGRASRFCGCDEFRRGARAEAGKMRRIVPRRNN